MRRRAVRVVWVIGICCLLLLLPPISQAQQALGEKVLQERTVLLSIGRLLVEGECLGFRLFRQDFPRDVDLVLTAALASSAKGKNRLFWSRL
jgi:hypothetical protein